MAAKTGVLDRTSEGGISVDSTQPLGKGPAAVPRTRITVVCGSRVNELDLRRLKARRVQGAIVIPLVEVWFAAGIGADLSTLAFDFVGEDGFRASRHAERPLMGTALSRGYLHTRTRNLTWDAEAHVEAAYEVRGVTMIVGRGT